MKTPLETLRHHVTGAIERGEKVTIRSIDYSDSGIGNNEQAARYKAHARLIAAAPELLEALEYMLRADEAIQENTGTKADQAMSRIAAIDAARAAIAKAKVEA